MNEPINSRFFLLLFICRQHIKILIRALHVFLDDNRKAFIEGGIDDEHKQFGLHKMSINKAYQSLDQKMVNVVTY